jgi:hypothetical protein
MIPKAQSTKERIDKLNFINLEIYTMHKAVKKMRKKSTDLGKIFAKDSFDKGP